MPCFQQTVFYVQKLEKMALLRKEFLFSLEKDHKGYQKVGNVMLI
jgi:hypothetical protein